MEKQEIQRTFIINIDFIIKKNFERFDIKIFSDEIGENLLLIKKTKNKKFFSFLIILKIENRKICFFTNIFLKNVFILSMV